MERDRSEWDLSDKMAEQSILGLIDGYKNGETPRAEIENVVYKMVDLVATAARGSEARKSEESGNTTSGNKRDLQATMTLVQALMVDADKNGHTGASWSLKCLWLELAAARLAHQTKMQSDGFGR